MRVCGVIITVQVAIQVSSFRSRAFSRSSRSHDRQKFVTPVFAVGDGSTF
jgi:hypothetical protein